MQERKYPKGGVHLKHAALSPDSIQTISGIPPITLRSVKPFAVKKVTVYGASGGVGDVTSNLFTTDNIVQVITRSSGAQVSYNGSNSITLTKTDVYREERTWFIIPSPGASLNVTISDRSATIRGIAAIDQIYTSINELESVTGKPTRKTVNTGSHPYLAIWAFNVSSSTTGVFTAEKIRLSVNSSSYEPYGYKIPLLIGSDTLYIYTDEQLGAGDSLILSHEARTAERNGTDISALQDWTQAWVFAASGDTVISVGTSVVPSIAIEYRAVRGS